MTATPATTPRSLEITQVVGTGLFSGIERYVVEVSNELASRGHRVHVIGGEPAKMRDLLGPFVRWSPGATPKEALRSLAAGGRRDVVHSHISKADFIALAAAPLTGGRRVSTRHIPQRRGYDGLSRRTAPLVHRALSREVAVSAWLAGVVETDPDTVIVNGTRDQPDTGHAREPLVLMAQRLAEEKDTDVGVRAWAASGLAERGWTLQIAGRGEERAAVERLIAELGVGDSVEVLGWVDDPDALYRRAGVLLAPAPTEPCGLVILEAMAHGLPVVAAGSGGNLETVGQHPGALLFPPRDHEAAAALLRDLAGDADRRAAYGRELQELQRRALSLPVHVDQLERVYLDVAR